MAGKRTTFRAEFKKQLVELYLQEQHEKTLAQVARENGVGVETLRVWVKKHREAPQVSCRSYAGRDSVVMVA